MIVHSDARNMNLDKKMWGKSMYVETQNLERICACASFPYQLR